MLTPERRAFLQAAYSALLRPSGREDDPTPAPAEQNQQVNPKQDNDSSPGPGGPKKSAPE